jgi:hypothetical protein
VRLIHGGVEFVITVENLQGLARGLPLVREIRDQDGSPVVVRISVSGDRWKGLRVELWGVRESGREEARQAREWEQQLRDMTENVLPPPALDS